MPQSKPQPITDARALKALAHPVRMRLIGELASRGSSRAVDLAKTIDEPANSVSFHLRQLARYGLVVEDTERGTDARERWWQLPSGSGFEVNLEELRALPGGPEAVGVFKQLTESTAHALVTAAYSHPENPKGKTKSWVSDVAMHLSKQEVDEFLEEQLELITRWMQRSRELADAGDGVERHTYYGLMVGAPIDEVLVGDKPAKQSHSSKRTPRK